MGTSGLFGSSKQLKRGSGDAAPDGMVDDLVFPALYVTAKNIGRFDHRTRNSFRSGKLAALPLSAFDNLTAVCLRKQAHNILGL
jgi:hypothetical protein